MLHRIPTAGMTREEWLEERKKSLGGSDMGAVLGLNKWRSPFAVWAEKTGKLPETEDNEAMRQGRDLEGYVAQRFEEKSGKRVQMMNYILRCDDAPHLHANIDRRIVNEKSGLECKTASALSMKSYRGGEFPESYYAQCVTYLAVTGWERWYLAAFVHNKAFYIYQITTIPDDECPAWCESSVYVSPDELAVLKRCAKDFWETYIETEEPPPPDGAESTTEAIESIYGESGVEVELFGRTALLEEYSMLIEEDKRRAQEIERIKQQLLLDMGGAERGSCGRYSVRHTPQVRRTFDIKAFQKDNPALDLTKYFKKTSFYKFTIKEEKET